MPATKSKVLSSLFRVTASLRKDNKSKSSAAAAATAAVGGATSKSSSGPSFEETALKNYVAAIKTTPPSASDESVKQSQPLSDIVVGGLKLDSAIDAVESSRQLTTEISSILCGDTDPDLVYPPNHINADESLENILDIPWFSSLSNNNISLRRKEISRERKQKWVFNKSQVFRFNKLVNKCGLKLGVDATLQIFGKLGRETGLKEYEALLTLCIEKARQTDDEEVHLDQNYKAYQLFQSMRELGFAIEEETYGPFLKYLIDFGMVQEFYFFADLFKHENPASLPRIAYYEMLLCVRLNNENKMQELCYEYTLYDGEDKTSYQENDLLALCEGGRRRELLMLLETLDITKVSSVERMTDIFRSLGKLLLGSYAEKFILTLKICGTNAASLSDLIYNYAISLPNFAVEDIISKFKQLHSELEVNPTSVQLEKLIKHSCQFLKVHVAIDVVDEMFNAGFTFSLETFHCILDACEESCEYNLVRRVYSMIRCHGLHPNNETYRRMVYLSVKMKDYEGAYDMINDMWKMLLIPSASIYNAIMIGYFREKNIHGALMVLKQMEDADVKPDSQTFSYLIGNSNTEEDIIKIFDEMKHAGVQVTKPVFMALINAYAACGQFEKAKQVILDKQIPVKNLNEIKSVLVSALASHGQISDALTIYEEIKQAECNLEPKAVISLIEHLHSEGDLERLLQLLKELQDPDYWIDGCYRVIVYCVHHNHLRYAIDLLKQVKEKFSDDEVATENLFDEVFCRIADIEPKNMKFGMGLLKAVKEELGLRPSRKSLDFLLSTCISARDLRTAYLIWSEYQTAGLPFNVLSFVRMYQTLLALGDNKSAASILNKMPKDDPHVCSVIKACEYKYLESASLRTKKMKKMKKMKKKEAA